MEGFVTDTMAIILWLEKRRMPHKAKNIFIQAERNEAILYIPAMALVETGYLAERKRIGITLTEVMSYLEIHRNFLLHPINAELIRNAFEITDIPELHDRLIAATGKLTGNSIITNDPYIIASNFVTTVWI